MFLANTMQSEIISSKAPKEIRIVALCPYSFLMFFDGFINLTRTKWNSYFRQLPSCERPKDLL